MNTCLTILTLFLAAALQAGLPTWSWLGGVRLEFLPAVAAYGALTLPQTGGVVLALAAGFIQDSLSAGPFGVTAFAYAVIALLLNSLRGSIDRDLPPVQMAAGAVTATTASVAACCFVRISLGALVKIALLGVLSAVITPFLFAALDAARSTGRRSA
jgi:rod shape-determining protein MreD